MTCCILPGTLENSDTLRRLPANAGSVSALTAPPTLSPNAVWLCLATATMTSFGPRRSPDIRLQAIRLTEEAKVQLVWSAKFSDFNEGVQRGAWNINFYGFTAGTCCMTETRYGISSVKHLSSTKSGFSHHPSNHSKTVSSKLRRLSQPPNPRATPRQV